MVLPVSLLLNPLFASFRASAPSLDESGPAWLHHVSAPSVPSFVSTYPNAHKDTDFTWLTPSAPVQRRILEFSYPSQWVNMSNSRFSSSDEILITLESGSSVSADLLNFVHELSHLPTKIKILNLDHDNLIQLINTPDIMIYNNLSLHENPSSTPPVQTQSIPSDTLQIVYPSEKQLLIQTLNDPARKIKKFLIYIVDIKPDGNFTHLNQLPTSSYEELYNMFVTIYFNFFHINKYSNTEVNIISHWGPLRPANFPRFNFHSFSVVSTKSITPVISDRIIKFDINGLHYGYFYSNEAEQGMMNFTGRCEDIPNIDNLTSLNIQLVTNNDCTNLNKFKKLKYLEIHSYMSDSRSKIYVRGLDALEKIIVYGKNLEIIKSPGPIVIYRV
jgi:hypothetical protein